ncbi:penicillin-binding protein activator [Litorimonas sp. RW-G-Af-16]|uniref:penicillin-binding protein activator n=1 Tax=Litorimonas sp. RW-G-Af-16 TaxID=3241168 RepID=UPI00390C5AB6
MPKHLSFDQFFSRRTAFCVSALAALMLSACATTSPAPTNYPGQAPVVKAPTEPVDTTPTKSAETDKDDDETKEIVPDAPDTPDDADDDETGNDYARTGEYFNNRNGLILPHMAGRDTKRLAILLPFSTGSSRLREEATSMYRAAELAVFEREGADVMLIALDTKGTEQGARSATQAAVNAGADVILGPIIAGNVQAAAREARRSKTPLLAFSNDQKVAGNGTYLLSFPPEAEVERIVDYVADQGTTRFAFMGPDNGYGRRVKGAYQAAVAARGGQVTASETYKGNDISVMQEPAQRLATMHAASEAEARRNRGLTPMAFEAILLPEGGNALRSLAPLLPYYEVDPADVQFMGTSRWQDEDTVREPALAGGVFAGPDREARAAFDDNYDRTYGEDPSSLATLAYDAVVLGAYIADGDPKLRRQRAEDPNGFYGVDGLVSFDSDGKPNRGLAVYTIRNGQFRVLDPAPTTTRPEAMNVGATRVSLAAAR